MIKALSIFSGNANRELFESICSVMEVSPGASLVSNFSDGESFVEIRENVRNVNCFVVQPTSSPVNQNLMELLIMIDALKRASAGSIVAIIPYFGYARQDRRPRSARVPITAKLVADLLSTAGAQRVLTMDLHKAQIQGFFDIPVDHLFAAPVIIEYLSRLDSPKLTLVAPDAGGAERARAYAKRLGGELAVMRQLFRQGLAEGFVVVHDEDGMSQCCRCHHILPNLVGTG